MAPFDIEIHFLLWAWPHDDAQVGIYCAYMAIVWWVLIGAQWTETTLFLSAPTQKKGFYCISNRCRAWTLQV